MYKTVNIAEKDSDYYQGLTQQEKERIFSVLSGKKIKICEIEGNAIIGEEMMTNPGGKFDISIHCLSVLGKYFRLKENALSNLPNALRRDLGKMIYIKRQTRIHQFKKIVRLMMKNYHKMPKKIINKFVKTFIHFS
jgi:hypothetical protein